MWEQWDQARRLALGRPARKANHWNSEPFRAQLARLGIQSDKKRLSESSSPGDASGAKTSSARSPGATLALELQSRDLLLILCIGRSIADAFSGIFGQRRPFPGRTGCAFPSIWRIIAAGFIRRRRRENVNQCMNRSSVFVRKCTDEFGNEQAVRQLRRHADVLLPYSECGGVLELL